MRYLTKSVVFFLMVAVLGSQARPVAASQESTPAYDWYACQDEARRLELQESIPKLLLTAVTYTETGRRGPFGRRVMSWPWTLHAQGKSLHFDTKEEAASAVRRLMREGVKSIDVGCMQINLRYHPHAFTSVEEALDPRANLSYGVAYLKKLKARHNGWPSAIQNYHSTNQAVNQRYRRKVLATWDQLRRDNATARARNGISRPAQARSMNEQALISRPTETATLSLLGQRENRKPWTLHKKSSSLRLQELQSLAKRVGLKPLPFRQSRPHAKMIVALSPGPGQKLSPGRPDVETTAKTPTKTAAFNTVALFSHTPNQSPLNSIYGVSAAQTYDPLTK